MKNLSLTLLLSLLAIPAFTQVRPGFRLGVNASGVQYELGSGPWRTYIGGTAGLLLEIPVADRLSVQPEIAYSERAQRIEFTDVNGEPLGKSRFVFSFLEVPLLVKYRFGTERTRLYLQAGPQYGYNLAAWSRVEGERLSLDLTESDFVRHDLSGVLGMGVQFARFLVDARYGHGFTSRIRNFDRGDGQRYRTGTLSLGYQF